MNALTSTTTPKKKKKKKKILANLVLKKNIILFLILSLLVNDCILIYLETTILSIYNFLILYKCLFGFFFFPLYTSAPTNLKF